MANIILSEKELTVQVRNLDVVVVGDSERAIWSARKSHKCHGLNVFAAKSTSADHECLDVSKFFLDIATVDLNLVVVAGVQGLAIDDSFRWQRFKAVVMHPLFEGHILSGVLNNFLRDESSKEGGHGDDGTGRVCSHFFNNIFIDIFYIYSILLLSLTVYDVGKVNNLCEVFSIVVRVATFCSVEHVHGNEGNMELLRSAHSEVVHI